MAKLRPWSRPVGGGGASEASPESPTGGSVPAALFMRFGFTRANPSTPILGRISKATFGSALVGILRTERNIPTK